ncbi:MAG: hypothetical protein ACRD6X_03270 [Pyrinomonadaceae bacterium]
MRMLIVFIFAFLFAVPNYAQSDLQAIVEADKKLAQAAAETSVRSAFLEHLSNGSTIFQPTAMDGKQYWLNRPENSPARLIRRFTDGDVASNGILGYTTGNWELRPTGKVDAETTFGQYLTVWQRDAKGQYHAVLDIGITHDKYENTKAAKVLATDGKGDLNKGRWSAADPSMNFLRAGMANKGLRAAYKKFAADDIRLLREESPPIVGKKNVVAEVKDYRSIGFPRKMALTESADLAFVWNPCEFADNDEGRVRGNCLHIWKFHDNKWLIVAGVIAAVRDRTPPVLKGSSTSNSSSRPDNR